MMSFSVGIPPNFKSVSFNFPSKHKLGPSNPAVFAHHNQPSRSDRVVEILGPSIAMPGSNPKTWWGPKNPAYI